jgi:hypothetical protein
MWGHYEKRLLLYFRASGPVPDLVGRWSQAADRQLPDRLYCRVKRLEPANIRVIVQSSDA